MIGKKVECGKIKGILKMTCGPYAYIKVGNVLKEVRVDKEVLKLAKK